MNVGAGGVGSECGGRAETALECECAERGVGVKEGEGGQRGCVDVTRSKEVETKERARGAI